MISYCLSEDSRQCDKKAKKRTDSLKLKEMFSSSRSDKSTLVAYERGRTNPSFAECIVANGWLLSTTITLYCQLLATTTTPFLISRSYRLEDTITTSTSTMV